MPRISLLAHAAIPAPSLEALAPIEQRFGFLPNSYRVAATSPKAINAMVSLQSALAGSLGLELMEKISIAVSSVNDCEYDLASHAFLSAEGSEEEQREYELARSGLSSDGSVQVALQFARKVAHARGHVSVEDMSAIKSSGYTDGQVLEIIGAVISCCLSNYISNVFEPDLDFPVL